MLSPFISASSSL